MIFYYWLDSETLTKLSKNFIKKSSIAELKIGKYLYLNKDNKYLSFKEEIKINLRFIVNEIFDKKVLKEIIIGYLI